jgi:uncharacterized protein (DUF58 family)
VLEFEAVRFARVEPLGLMKAGTRRALPATLLGDAAPASVAPLHLPGTRRLQPGGIAFAGRVGDAEEFVSLRDYRAGDSPRRIHWKAWARTGRLVVKEYQDEFFVRHALVLDTFGYGTDECFEAAVSLAASLVMMPRGNESLLDLMFVEERAYTLTQGPRVSAPRASSCAFWPPSPPRPAATSRRSPTPWRSAPDACRALSACCSRGTSRAGKWWRGCARAAFRCACGS